MTCFSKIGLTSALAGAALCASSPALAAPSLNVVQECQALLEFTSTRVGEVDKYDADKVKAVQDGLSAYDAFLQSEHIEPGLLKFTKGDASAAATYQTQIDSFKAQIVTALGMKHPQPRIFTDQAVAIDSCYSKAPMGADQTQMMTTVLETLVGFAMQG